MDKPPFYITTTLPYVNAEPHMGHALEFVRADVIARWKKLQGFDVAFNTGTDEHGQKILKAAKSANVSPKEYADTYAAHFKDLLELLGVSDDVLFTRTTAEHHERATQEFWKRVAANGYIYKKNYQTKYCVACEEAKTESELMNGRCPLHPTLELELIDEENYFFKYSEFGDRLLKLYDSGAFRVVPDFRLNEMREFIKRGLLDFSISRLASKMPWGVPVPGDPDHVMYVWMDALPSYITALGWPEDAARFERFWKGGTPTQYCGKDNTRFQAVMWQAMLMAAGLQPTHTVVVNGFVTGEGGIKMSKSLGNVVSPVEIIQEYGTDALRYFVCRELSSFEDSPFSAAMFKDAYNAGLANGLGNLASRVLKLTSTYLKHDSLPSEKVVRESVTATTFTKYLDEFNIQAYCNEVWKLVASNDRKIQVTEPFKLLKSSNPVDFNNGISIMSSLYKDLWRIALLLEPVMPVTSQTLQNLVRANKMPEKPLFMRK